MARTINILVGALGGDGGGVLCDWIISAAHAQGLGVQATQIPGVAQRTGATTYYIEVFNQQLQPGKAEPQHQRRHEPELRDLVRLNHAHADVVVQSIDRGEVVGLDALDRTAADVEAESLGILRRDEVDAPQREEHGEPDQYPCNRDKEACAASHTVYPQVVRPVGGGGTTPPAPAAERRITSWPRPAGPAWQALP